MDTYRLLTDAGPSAIAVLSLTGPGVPAFLARHVHLARQKRSPDVPLLLSSAFTPGTVTRADLLDTDGEPIDDILLSVHRDTPNWNVRLHLHGNPWLVQRCEELLRNAGFAPAGGHAALWPTLDQIAIEAHALLPSILTERGVRWVLRQADRLRDVLTALLAGDSLDDARQRCRQITDASECIHCLSVPLRVALIGPPNSGKSTLANALADRAVSLVSDQAGTTRDWIEIVAEADGFPIAWLDTAGLRDAGDDLEAESMRRTRQLIESADVLALVLEADTVEAHIDHIIADLTGRPTAVVWNKADLGQPAPAARELPSIAEYPQCHVSALRAAGLEQLGQAVLHLACRALPPTDDVAAYTPRQVNLIAAAASSPDWEGFRHALQQCLYSDNSG